MVMFGPLTYCNVSNFLVWQKYVFQFYIVPIPAQPKLNSTYHDITLHSPLPHHCIVLYCSFGLGSRHLCLPVEHNIKFPGPGQQLTENNSVVTSPSAGQRAIPACMWLQLGFPNYNAGAYARLKILIKIYPVGNKPKWRKEVSKCFYIQTIQIQKNVLE